MRLKSCCLPLLPFALVMATACGGGGESEVEVVIPQESIDLFNTRCAVCHGETGAGDGAAAVALDPKPRNYSDKAWQKTVTDEEIAKTIIEGGSATGLSPLMTPNPDLADKPEVVAGLVAIIRGFAK